MLSRQHDTAIDLAEVAVVLRARRIRPIATAAKREGYPMPGNRDAVLEFAFILGVNGGAEFQRTLDPLRGRHRRELIRVGAVEQVGSEQHAAPAAVVAG